MTREEDELRRALEARSSDATPEFRARLSAALAGGRPMSNAAPAMAALAAAVLIAGAVIGVLVSSRQVISPVTGGRPTAGPASAPRSAPASPPPQAGVLTPPPGPIPMPNTVELSARSSYVVWALVAGMYLYRSVDGGNTWQQRPVPPGPSGPSVTVFNDISFVDDQNGWLFTGGGGATQCSFGGATILHTADAGATWQRVVNVEVQGDVARSIGFAQCKDNPSLVDGMHGFVDAGDSNGRPTIYRTADGGATWGSCTLADPPGFITYGSGDTLRAGRVKSFGGTLLVSATGGQPDGAHQYVFESTDGGATFTSVADASTIPQDLAFVTASRWISVGGRLETTDSGKTWHALATDYSQAAGVAPQVVFGDSVVGYATVRGSIQRTSDGGAHWTVIRTPGT